MSLDFVTNAAILMIKHGDIDLVNHAITAHLIYTPNRLLNTILTYDDIECLGEIDDHLFTKGVYLKHKSFNNSVFDADPVIWESIGNNMIYQKIVAIALVHVKTGALIALLRKPFVLNKYMFNGGDIVINWDNGPNKIFNIKEDLEKIE